MSRDASDGEYETFEPTFPPSRDPGVIEWRKSVQALSPSAFVIREATTDAEEGRRMQDLQTVCAPLTVQSVRQNAATIAEKLVLFAEIDTVHVGFCISSPGRESTDPLFVHAVAVAPAAQRRGIGIALLSAATEREPQRSIALATQDDNVAARSMNEQFAKSIGASIRKTTRSTDWAEELDVEREHGYHAWIIERQ